MSEQKLLVGWKEIAQAMGGYHPNYLRCLFIKIRDKIELKYWLGKKRRIIMTQEEAKAFKEMLMNS